MTTPVINIRRVAVDEILPLRHKILRAGMPLETARFDGDLTATTVHMAASANFDSAGPEQIVGCLSWMLNSYNNEPAWQLRGMAVDEACQGSGIGRKLLAKSEEALVSDGRTNLLWCNARVPAAGFYTKLGWTVVSEVFEIPTAGPHVKMTRKLSSAKPRETVEKAAGRQ